MRRFCINLSLILVSLAIVTGFSELALRLFYPISVTNVGYIDRPNGELYGWGFEPFEPIRIEMPDSGKVMFNRVNSKGWRDRERTTQKPKNTFRVMVLGDSMTFGYIVPSEKTFTYILEEQLKGAGINVEILNISYSGWGTDQAYEALQREGSKYGPDLVIYHFVSNDPSDNIWHLDTGKRKGRKPFYYEIENDGVTRHVNLKFTDEKNTIRRKNVISKSEILKRAWLLSRSLKNKNKKAYLYDPIVDDRIQYFLEINKTHPLLGDLKSLKEHEFGADILETISQKYKFDQKKQSALETILSNTPGNREGLIDGHDNLDVYAEQPWLLTKNLIQAMMKKSTELGADFAVLSDMEEGRYQWEKSWLRALDTSKAREYFFSVNHFLSSAISNTRAELIPSPMPHTRARNDSHINIEGNQAIADNLYQYITLKYSDTLPNAQ